MNEVIVEKDKLKHNLEVIKTHLKKGNNKNAQIIGVVKLNGYGLDIIKHSKFLLESGINTLAVASMEEALKIRNAGLDCKLLMLTSTAIESEILELAKKDVIITIGSYYALKAAENVSKELGRKIDAHIKIDTGFGRFGFIYNDLDNLSKSLKESDFLNILGCFSHFSNAYYDDKYTNIQYQRFVAMTKKLELDGINLGIKHISNTSAFIKFPKMNLEAVRLGSIITGRVAFSHDLDLKEVGYLKSNICDIKDIPNGFNVGYSNTYTSKKKTRLGLIPIGTSQGVNVEASNDMLRTVDSLRELKTAFKNVIKKRVLTVDINSEKVNILGRIGGSHIAVDITGKDINIGDVALPKANIKYVDSSINRRWV